MLRLVWIDDWQMQCCGAPFRVGERVEFSTTSAVDREFLGDVLGQQRSAAVTDREDHHDLGVGPMSPLTGTVTAIEAISCRWEHRDGAMQLVPGTTKAVLRQEATGREPEDGDFAFVGYVVTLQTEDTAGVSPVSTYDHRDPSGDRHDRGCKDGS